MKRAKTISLILAIIMCAAICFSGCGKSREQIPEQLYFPIPGITLNDENIDYVSERDANDTDFAIVIKDSEILKANIGDTVMAYFPYGAPSSVKVTDVLLDRQGNAKYDKDYDNDVASSISDDTVTFDIPVNAAVYLDLNSEDYVDGRSLRGFVLEAQFDGFKMDYTFALDINIEQ